MIYPINENQLIRIAQYVSFNSCGCMCGTEGTIKDILQIIEEDKEPIDETQFIKRD